MNRNTRIGLSLGAFYAVLLGLILNYFIRQAMIDPYISRYKEILNRLIFMDVLAYFAGMAILGGLIGLWVHSSQNPTEAAHQ